MHAIVAARSRCHRKRYLDGHHLRHWVDGGETSADNMTLLCTHHHRRLHEGGFSIVREEGDTLRFVTDDGRSIPRNGYRLEDFVDDDIDGGAENPPRGGFCTTTVQRRWEHAEVRETAAVYRLRRTMDGEPLNAGCGVQGAASARSRTAATIFGRSRFIVARTRKRGIGTPGSTATW